MKARKYDRRILNGETVINITSFVDSDDLDDGMLSCIADGDERLLSDLEVLKETYINAREYGSLIKAPAIDIA